MNQIRTFYILSKEEKHLYILNNQGSICPVCNELNSKGSDICSRCNFHGLTKTFISDEEKERWYREVVNPYRELYEKFNHSSSDQSFVSDTSQPSDKEDSSQDITDKSQNATGNNQNATETVKEKNIHDEETSYSETKDSKVDADKKDEHNTEYNKADDEKTSEQEHSSDKKSQKKPLKKRIIKMIISVYLIAVAIVSAVFAIRALQKNKTEYTTFGQYEQDNDTSNGKEAIEWIVLDKQDDKALLISRYALDCKQYNTEYENVTWEASTLREWLNNEFLNSAFDSDEQKRIISSKVTADKNPSYSTSAGNDTTDKIFLLGIEESNKYFKSNDIRKCEATDYAKAQGAYTTDNGCCLWWLRSPGGDPDCAACVIYNGSVGYFGGSVDDDDFAVRPVLWVNLES